MDINESESTRNLIVQSAKFNFYNLGYKKTTISKIFDEIDVPVGVFTYYFKKKDMLVYEIYKDFFSRINQLVLASYPNLETSYLLKQAVLSKIYYQIILNDEKNAKFYYEVLEKDSNYRVNKEITIPIFRKYIEEFDLIISEEQFELINILNAGARREFFVSYFKNKLTITPYEISDLFEQIIPLLLGIDKSIIDSTLMKSASIAKSIDTIKTLFLV